MMCDPATAVMLGLSAVSAVGSLFGSKGNTTNTTVNQAPPVSAAKTPAIAAPTARKTGADVRIGQNATEHTAGVPSQAGKFKERRKAAQALGGLGRAGLVI